MTNASLKKFRRTTRWLCFFSFELIVLGALVRATNSGLACPDWPMCFGQWLPAMDMQIFLEWFHRLSALGLGGVLIYAGYQLCRESELRKMFLPQIAAIGALFLLQCILGGLTVLKLLNPAVVSLHLFNALIFYSLLLWTGFVADKFQSYETRQTSSPKLAIGLAAFSCLVFAQVILGGAVSTNHAGVACPDFPLCHGEMIPPMSFLVALHFSHRIVAYVVVLFSLVLVFWSKNETNPFVKRSILAIPFLLILQIVLGVVNIWYSLPVWGSVLHLTNALIIFTLALSSCFREFYPSFYARQLTSQESR